MNYVVTGYWVAGYVTSDSEAEVTSALQEIAPGALIELFQLELNVAQHGVEETYYFHPGTNANGYGELVWNGQAYMALPVEVEGFEYNGQGTLPRPKMRISNILGTVTTIILALPEGLEGAKFTRIRTLGRFLDAANFPPQRNLYNYTEDFTNAVWSKGNISITSNATMAPGGTITADKIANTATTSVQHNLNRTDTVATTATVTYSIFAKAAERDFIQLRFIDFGAFAGKTSAAGFNLTLGTVVYNSDPSICTPAISSVGNGWYRCSITSTPATAGSVRSNVALSTTGSDRSYIENIGWGPYVWGAQLEIGSTPSEYQPVTGNAFTGNPAGVPDPFSEFPREVFFVDRKSAENRDVVEFEMASAFDMAGVRAPKRQCITRCQWVYRGEGCGYTGFNYFNASDEVVGNANQDVCGKRVDSCKLRFGDNSELPFGGYPGIGTYFA